MPIEVARACPHSQKQHLVELTPKGVRCLECDPETWFYTGAAP